MSGGLEYNLGVTERAARETCQWPPAVRSESPFSISSKNCFTHPPSQLPAPHTPMARNVIRVLEDQKLDATDGKRK